MEMKMVGAIASSLVLASMLSLPAHADHMSIHGEGWANMPNDIHNTRIDTRLSGDNNAFKDFVRMGAGADSVNRFLDTTTNIRGNRAMGSDIGARTMGGGRSR